jgi:magnesium-transporting ATPase (P-type)
VLRLLVHQFRSPVVYLLSGAAGLAFYFGELEEGSAIFAVLAINTVIGFVTELKAVRSIEALRALGARTARVRRDGRFHVIPAEDLVPGDVVILEAGDAVSADLRMARQNALIERLSAVETLGAGYRARRSRDSRRSPHRRDARARPWHVATTVILTDKTGTLTENRMTVRRLCTSSGEIEFGTGAPEGGEGPQVADDPQAAELLRIAVLCNDAHLDGSEEGGSGDPMEIALLRAELRAGFRRTALLEGRGVVGKHAFDPVAKMMATVHEHGEGVLIAVKGARPRLSWRLNDRRVP